MREHDGGAKTEYRRWYHGLGDEKLQTTRFQQVCHRSCNCALHACNDPMVEPSIVLDRRALVTQRPFGISVSTLMIPRPPERIKIFQPLHPAFTTTCFLQNATP